MLNEKIANKFLCLGLGLAIGASLMDLKKATTLASVTVMTFMLAGGYFVKVNYIQLLIKRTRL